MAESPQSQPGTEATPTNGEPGTAAASAPGTASAPPKSKHDRLMDMLRDDGKADDKGNLGDGREPGTGKAGGSQNAKPKKFNELATSLGVELKDLYALEIAEAADGKPITVQQLKDHHAARSDFSVREFEWEEERTRQSNELVRASSELREIMAALPKSALKPEVIEAVKQKHEATVKREQESTLRVIPEWRDRDTMTKDLSGMVDYLKGYGFPTPYLQSVTDHRMMKLIRDSWRREQRVKQALEAVKQDKPGNVGAGKPNGGQPPAKPREGASSPTKGRAGLLALLNEGKNDGRSS